MLELREFATVLSGVAIRETKDGSAAFMRLSDVSDLKAGVQPALVKGEAPEVARAWRIERGDLIVGARGSATDVCIATEAVFGAFVSLDLYLVRPDPNVVSPEYLFAFLTLPATQAQFAVNKQGSSLARLPKDALEAIEVPLPPMRQQRLIADLARSFEEESRLLKKLSELNATLGRELVARAIRAADTKHFVKEN